MIEFLFGFILASTIVFISMDLRKSQADEIIEEYIKVLSASGAGSYDANRAAEKLVRYATKIGGFL